MNANELQRLYEQAGSCAALTRMLGVPVPTMRSRLIRAGIQLKQSGYHSPKKVRYYGTEHHNWKGGTPLHGDGYVMEYAPDHPAAKNTKGYVLQHRLVMERQLGRYLLPTEVVHHVNGNKQDNRPENLELHTRSTHMTHHKSVSPRDAKGRFSR